MRGSEQVEVAPFYDWERTLSFGAQALVTMVVTARGRGKTYGLRRQCVKDFLKDGSRFVEVSRHVSYLKMLAADYFAKLQANGEFEGYVFKIDRKQAYIAEKSDNPEWQLIGYFVALSEYQTLKTRTFVNVKRIIMDEAIIERLDRYHTYLPNEWAILTNVVDSITRETPGEKTKARVYLLANACDFINPAFQAFGIDSLNKLEYGYNWFHNKTVLVHYENPEGYSERKKEETLAGKMGAFTTANSVAADNVFVNANDDYIASKPKNASFEFGVTFAGKRFGIWIDERNGYIFIDPKIPNNTTAPVFALTREDNSVNYIAAQRSEKTLKNLVDMHRLGLIRYNTIATRETFLDGLSLFGVR